MTNDKGRMPSTHTPQPTQATHSIAIRWLVALVQRRLASLGFLFLVLAIPVAALLGTLNVTILSTVWAAPPIREFTIGLSAQRRPITAVQIGDGERKLVVVGATHGGAEANTYHLTLELIAHFRENPDEVPPNVRLYLIPALNPDGLALNTRFDAAGVDLNRNMNTNLDTCAENDWATTVYGAYGIISDTGGPYPDSQVESRLIKQFLLDASGAIFLHSNAGLVFPAYCDHQPSIGMAQVYAEAAGYLYNRYWLNYMITGGMHDWAGSLGIAAITPELITATETEFDQNLAGIQAVLAQADDLLPLPEDHMMAGIRVPAQIWRYWRAHGGEAVFGVPLEPVRRTKQGLAQTFSQARIELNAAQVDTPLLLQPTMLGISSAEALGYTEGHPAFAPGDPATAPLFFAETGHTLREAFLYYWQRNGGSAVFGYPISEEFTTTTSDGQRRIVQYFERAVFAYYPEDGSVRLEPLGWQAVLVEGVRAPSVAPHVR